MDANLLEQTLGYLCEELGGDWLLTGGALVRLSFDTSRGTEDIDLVRVAHPELSDTTAKNKLFRWLMARGSGPEWVNSAVEPFVREVESWEQELVEIRRGGKGRVFRPNLTLFVYLKLRRGTPIDMEDIRKAAAKCPEPFDPAKFEAWSDSVLKERFAKSRAALGI